VNGPLAGLAGGESVFAFTAHYAGSIETTAAFVSYTGFLHSLIDIGLDLRLCTTNGDVGGEGQHPGYQKTLRSGALVGTAWGNCIATWGGDDDEWFDLSYTAIDGDGTDLGHGKSAIADFNIQARVTTAGVLEIRIDNGLADGFYFNGSVIEGFVRRIACPTPPGTSEVPIIEFGNGHDHEDLDMEEIPEGVEWGDGIWYPSA